MTLYKRVSKYRTATQTLRDPQLIERNQQAYDRQDVLLMNVDGEQVPMRIESIARHDDGLVVVEYKEVTA